MAQNQPGERAVQPRSNVSALVAIEPEGRENAGGMFPEGFSGAAPRPNSVAREVDTIGSVVDAKLSALRLEPSARILLVEDDEPQAQSLAFILAQEGYAVELAGRAAECLERLSRPPSPDLVVLDVSLPDLSGVQVARRVRQASRVPILMVTARREESDKIVGLDAGADDYVTKPFSSGELLARIRSLLRRATAPEPAAAGRVYETGALVVDTGARRVMLAGRQVAVSPREFDILSVLAQAEGRVVGRKYLFESVWGPAFFGDESALDVYVRAIRKKIEPDRSRPTYLHTLRGVGYRLAEEPPEPV
jgi:DNA-binding response OmpR family regulator